MIAVVIPSFRVRSAIGTVLADIPPCVDAVYVVDDCCPEHTGDFVAAQNRDPRVSVLRMEQNAGVGGATIRGFEQAFADGATIAVKVDGDGQMRQEYLPALIAPLLAGRADFTKGNRFFDLAELRQMPAIRRFGNIGLSVLTKFASGYWQVTDPTNGFIAIHRQAFAHLSPQLIDRRFFFETSILVHLNIIGATVLDVPIPARYGTESSNLSVGRCLVEFPLKLGRHLLRRIVLRYFFFDVNAASVFLLLGALTFAFGFGFGALRWYQSYVTGVPQSSGTVGLALLPLVLGSQLLLQAVLIDIIATPRSPLQTAFSPSQTAGGKRGAQ
jgi:dolichol-phosphate mannosyltransferase